MKLGVLESLFFHFFILTTLFRMDSRSFILDIDNENLTSELKDIKCWTFLFSFWPLMGQNEIKMILYQ